MRLRSTTGSNVKRPEDKLSSGMVGSSVSNCAFMTASEHPETESPRPYRIIERLKEVGWDKELTFLGDSGIATMSKLPIVRQSSKLTEGGECSAYTNAYTLTAINCSMAEGACNTRSILDRNPGKAARRRIS